MTYIHEISIASPQYVYTNEEVLEALAPWIKSAGTQGDLFRRIVNNSGIRTRRFVLPIEEILAFRGMEDKAVAYKRYALRLAIDVFRGFKSHQTPSTIVSSSCTMPILPSLDMILLDALELPATTKRYPMHQHGCIGGVVGLSLSASLALESPVAMIACELCSLIFQGQDTTAEQLVGNALFADGAGGAILSQEAGVLEICQSVAHYVPGTTEELGYKLNDYGPHLLLSKKLPEIVKQALPQVLGALCRDLSIEDPRRIKHWLVHPGGLKILDAVKQCFSLAEEQMTHSYEVLKNYGNLSSAAIFHVLQSFIQADQFSDGDIAVVIGIGPGVSLKGMTLRCHR